MESEMEGLLTLGRALWVDPVRRRRQWLETHAAVVLQGGGPTAQIERMAQALLSRARRGSHAATAVANDPMAAWDQPFYRLEADERLVLSALHNPYRWSYERLGRVLGHTEQEIERLAWRARMRLASHLKREGRASYPVGAARASLSCPEYEGDRPWTQRFLDEELVNGNEALFLQNHLMACAGCQAALTRCRDFYFEVDVAVREALIETTDDQLMREQARRDRVWLKPATERTFVESLMIFTQRPDVRWVGLGMLLLAAAKVARLLMS